MKNEIEFSVYAGMSKEAMWDKGEELGLTGEALSLFRHGFCEVKLTGIVDITTGEVRLTGAEYGKQLLEAK